MGISIRTLSRFYPLNNSNCRFYFESSGGFIYYFDHFPKTTNKNSRLGTNWNGTTLYVVGGDINVSAYSQYF